MQQLREQLYKPLYKLICQTLVTSCNCVVDAQLHSQASYDAVDLWPLYVQAACVHNIFQKQWYAVV